MKKKCANGHIFEKTSDCPVCPICEKAKQANPEFPKIGKPALRALANAAIHRLDDLRKWSEADVLRLHGMGPKAIAELKAEMKRAKVQFKKPKPKVKK